MKFQKPCNARFIRYGMHHDFILFFSKEHNSRKGDNLVKKKNEYQLFCHEESLYEISKP